MILLFSCVLSVLVTFGQFSSINGGEFTLPPPPTLPSVGVCQTYSGKLCEEYLKNTYVFVAPNKTVQDVETEISTVFNIFRQSK